VLWDSVTGPSAAASASNSWLRPANRDARWRAIAAVAGSMAAAVVAAGLTLHRAATQRDAIEEQAAMVGKGAAKILNGEVATAQALVDGLSAARGLRSRDFDALRQQMTVASQPEDSWLMLLDSGTYANRPFSRTGTETAIASPGPVAARTRLLTEARPLVAVRSATPPPMSVGARSDAAGQLQSSGFPSLLANESSASGAFDNLTLPQDRAGIISDRDGSVISGRRRGPEARNGLSTDLARRMQGVSSGILSRDRGSRVVTSVAGWLAAVGVPTASLRVPLHKALLAIGVAGAGFMLGGIGLSAWIYRLWR
jgi:hypothetical protein